MSKWEDNEEIKLFREYLRIPSVHPDPDYKPCVEFLERQAKNLNLPINIYYPSKPTKPVVIITWTGTDPTQPSIVLNSHMDVVPVYPELWKYPPFEAHIDDEGRIYARGSQDMKNYGMNYLGAIRLMRSKGVQLKRTVHVMFVPDEEIGGADGMAAFVKTDEFKALNTGFALDEAGVSPNDTAVVSYGERIIWHLTFKCNGTAGHGSLPLKNTPGEKARYIIDKLMDLRKENEDKLENNPELLYGDVTSINLTIMEGGVQSNVIPPAFSITFDFRISVDTNLEEFEETLQLWCDEAGGDVEMIFEQKDNYVEPTKTDDSNPYWVAFDEALTKDLNIKYQKIILLGGTDSRQIRALGIPVIGFSPIRNTEVLLHDNNEYIKADMYLEGIGIYEKILERVANI